MFLSYLTEYDFGNYGNCLSCYRRVVGGVFVARDIAETVVLLQALRPCKLARTFKSYRVFSKQRDITL
jgi:hypothetical protein